MKGLLLRVGIDKGVGGCLAPIFKDGSFEFIPIPERRATAETRLYENMIGINTGKRIIDIVSPKLKYCHPHFDPEFDTFTYGDVSEPKHTQLAELEPNDLLIFYAGLQKKKCKEKPLLYVIGYFCVEKVYDFKKANNYEDIFSKLRNNAHAKIYYGLKKLKVKYSDNDLIIVKGNPEKSKLLKKAIKIGDEKDYIRQDLKDVFGYGGSILRAVGHWITSEYISKVEKELKKSIKKGRG